MLAHVSQKVAECATLVYNQPHISKTQKRHAPLLLPLSFLLILNSLSHSQFHPIIPCRSTCVCLTNPTLLPMIPSPPTPKSSFLGKLNDSVVNADSGNACKIDVIGLEALRSPSRLLLSQYHTIVKWKGERYVQDHYLTTAQLCICGAFWYRGRLKCCCCGGSFGLVEEE
jgi:hypothetical protein